MNQKFKTRLHAAYGAFICIGRSNLCTWDDVASGTCIKFCKIPIHLSRSLLFISPLILWSFDVRVCSRVVAPYTTGQALHHDFLSKVVAALVILFKAYAKNHRMRRVVD